MLTAEQEELLVEVDESQEDEVHITYDIAAYPSDFTLSGIVESGTMATSLYPIFSPNLFWSIKQASLLIESFLLGLPVCTSLLYMIMKTRTLD
ncbi:MAG: hypothetical protein IPM76_07970 [Chloroflexi bacterium]|nr:hypothetical protein [Chloroflexota bacterium]